MNGENLDINKKKNIDFVVSINSTGSLVNSVGKGSFTDPN